MSRLEAGTRYSQPALKRLDEEDRLRLEIDLEEGISPVKVFPWVIRYSFIADRPDPRAGFHHGLLFDVLTERIIEVQGSRLIVQQCKVPKEEASYIYFASLAPSMKQESLFEKMSEVINGLIEEINQVIPGIAAEMGLIPTLHRPNE